MTEEVVQQMKISDMLRQTASNTGNLMMQIANHIDNLEEEIVQLKDKIAELESK